MVRSTKLGTPLPLLAALVLVVGCDSQSAGEQQAAASATSTPASSAAQASPAPPPAMDAEPVVELPADTVHVTLSDAHIEMPETLPSGRTVFLVTNTSEQDHTIELGLESPEFRLDPPVAPGENRSMVFTLSAGVWDVYCPIGRHRYQGEEVELRVGG